MPIPDKEERLRRADACRSLLELRRARKLAEQLERKRGGRGQVSQEDATNSDEPRGEADEALER